MGTTAEQRRAAVLEIRDHLRRALVGDLPFLDIEESARVCWPRALIRSILAFVLTAAAVGLPYLPVTATGARCPESGPVSRSQQSSP